MTQRLEAERILTKLRLLSVDDLNSLQEILARAQNEPPHGHADGSINEEAWLGLHCIVGNLRDTLKNLDLFKRSLS